MRPEFEEHKLHGACCQKKSATRKITAARGSSGKMSVPVRKNRRGPSQKPAFAAEPQKSVARKRGRPPGPGRKTSTTVQADLLSAQLEVINDKLQSMVGLRNDIQDLRDSIEVLSGALDAMLKANRGSVETAAEEAEPPAAHEPIEFVEAEVSETADVE